MIDRRAFTQTHTHTHIYYILHKRLNTLFSDEEKRFFVLVRVRVIRELEPPPRVTKRKEKKNEWKHLGKIWKSNGTTFTCHRVEYDRVIITSDLTRPFQKKMDSVDYIIIVLSCQRRCRVHAGLSSNTLRPFYPISFSPPPTPFRSFIVKYQRERFFHFRTRRYSIPRLRP